MVGEGCDFGYYCALPTFTPLVYSCWAPVPLFCGSWVSSGAEGGLVGVGTRAPAWKDHSLDAGWEAATQVVPHLGPRESLDSEHYQRFVNSSNISSETLAPCCPQ